MGTALALSGAAIFLAMTALWARQRVTKNATSLDVAWTLGIAAQTALLAALSDGTLLRRAVLTGLVFLWAARLGLHLYRDRVRAGTEDARYARFRREWSAAAFYGMYLLQGALVFLLPLTFVGAFGSERPFPGVLDFVGVALWAVSIAGEAAADRQLARFRADPANKGKTCRDGLWRFSRHPNYFFEWLIWCAYVPLSLGTSLWWTALLGPSLLLFLLTKVSGIPPTEAQAVASRGEDYRAYQRATPAFFPWFPKTENISQEARS